MESANFYWTVIAGIVGVLWIGVQFIRDRIAQSVSRTNAAVNRLIEIDRLIIDNPETQRYLSKTAKHHEDYFHDDERLNEDLFYKTKTLVYMRLNTFDEILSLLMRKKGITTLLVPAILIESEDWESYILVKLRHPLYRCILNREQDIFGESMRHYWRKHKTEVETAVIDPFVW